MIKKLKNDLQRRNEQMYQFYYRGIGNSIRKRRLELSMTQEALAKGICSNTYISKIENNAIAINKENLYMIMERMDLPVEAIGFPEEMVGILEKSFTLFFRKDFQGYAALMEDIRKYEFGILIQVARFGYHVLAGNEQEARPLYRELFRYLSSLEEFGLMTFVIYACCFNVMIADYENARAILEMVNYSFLLTDEMFAMYQFLKYVIYGHLQCFHIARKGYDLARTLFLEKNNLERIAELSVYKNLFSLYEGTHNEIKFQAEVLHSLSPMQKNHYLMLLATQLDDPETLLSLVDEKSKYYMGFLYQVALLFDRVQNKERYDFIKQLLAENHYLKQSPIDYHQLLLLKEGKDAMAYKDFLANVYFPYVSSIQNIYLMKKVTDEIVGILSARKRYKDALQYQEKLSRIILRLQTSSSVKTD